MFSIATQPLTAATPAAARRGGSLRATARPASAAAASRVPGSSNSPVVPSPARHLRGNTAVVTTTTTAAAISRSDAERSTDETWAELEREVAEDRVENLMSTQVTTCHPRGRVARQPPTHFEPSFLELNGIL